jgi:hypothetical protein
MRARDGSAENAMATASASFNVHWCSRDGHDVPIEPVDLRVEVAAGVQIEVAIAPRGAARLAVALTLTGLRRLRNEATASARFVVVPVDDASFLVAVAEPSDEPVILVPVPSSPTWTVAGGRMPTSDGWLRASRPEGAALEFRIVPGPEDMSVCALQISARPPAGARFANSRGSGSTGSVRFSVPRLSPQRLTLECEWEFHGAGGSSPSWP